MRVGHFWGPLQGALSQFIDIQGFDPLTTGMSQRLRQPCLFVLCPPKSQGVPQPPPPASARLSWWANQSGRQHYVTLMWAHSLFLPLFLFFVWLCIVLLHWGACQRELSVHWQCLVCHGHPHTCTVQWRAGSKNPKASLLKMHGNRYISSLLGDLLFYSQGHVSSGGESTLQSTKSKYPPIIFHPAARARGCCTSYASLLLGATTSLFMEHSKSKADKSHWYKAKIYQQKLIFSSHFAAHTFLITLPCHLMENNWLMSGTAMSCCHTNMFQEPMSRRLGWRENCSCT